MVIGLGGKLGSGKTTLIAGILTTYGIKNSTSPSFQLINSYKTEYFDIYHLDCYRLSNFVELENIGWRDCLYASSIMFIEWYNRFPELDLEYSIDIEVLDKEKRKITITGLEI